MSPIASTNDNSLTVDTPRAWLWSQQWRDVFFLHWPVAIPWLRSRLTKGLEIDTFEGQAWVSLVGFRLENVRLQSWPLMLCASCVEMNFRTYVRYRDEPAICFLSMHADSRLVVSAARMLTPLPYRLATMRYMQSDHERSFFCQPTGSDEPLLATAFTTSNDYAPVPSNLLDAWLLERYVAYVPGPGRLYRLAVWHRPWDVCPATLAEVRSSLNPSSGCIAHYSSGVAALLGSFERANS